MARIKISLPEEDEDGYGDNLKRLPALALAGEIPYKAAASPYPDYQNKQNKVNQSTKRLRS